MVITTQLIFNLRRNRTEKRVSTTTLHSLAESGPQNGQGQETLREDTDLALYGKPPKLAGC